jgi:para-aminobenzoate synthetase component 1
MTAAREIIPAPDPWDTAQRLSHLPHLCFLDSSDRHPIRGRFSYVAANPCRWLSSENFPTDRDLTRIQRPAIPGLPPFQGGWIGLLGYSLNRKLEAIPKNRFDDLPVASSSWGRYETVIAWDHHQDRCWLLGEHDPAIERALAKPLADPHRRHATPGPLAAPSVRQDRFSVPVVSNFSRDDYQAAVARAIDYVHAGDIFQVNLSQRLTTPLVHHPLTHYGRLRSASPAPFGAYFDLGETQILSASPEQFLKIDASGDVVTRPIKGTRPRGKNEEDDRRLLAELVNSPKDLAENVMIVDLMRNDLGRVCQWGSVRVTRICEVETHSYVHHLVSEVRGHLGPGGSPLELFRACFPGGSVTGAPKVRAMEIIAELEPTARGPYCGSMVWLGDDGAADSSILIRTMTAAHGYLQFPVGGGIVADSTPQHEFEETLHKAAGMVKALLSVTTKE